MKKKGVKKKISKEKSGKKGAKKKEGKEKVLSKKDEKEIHELEEEEEKLEHLIQNIESQISEQGFGFQETESFQTEDTAPVLRRIETAVGGDFQGVVFQGRRENENQEEFNYVSNKNGAYDSPNSTRRDENSKGRGEYFGNSPNYMINPDEQKEENLFRDPEAGFKEQGMKSEFEKLRSAEKENKKYLIEGDYKG